MNYILTLLLLSATLLASATSQAQPEPPTATVVDSQPWVDQGRYRIHFSTFTSDFLQPKTAAALGFSRAKNRVIVNIALTEKSADNHYSLGKPAQVTGTASNLMQQQKSLTFKEVSETNATYYLAELRFTNEEVMHFAITIRTPDGESLPLTFSRKLYVND